MAPPPSPFTLRTDIYPAISPSQLSGSLKGKNALVTGSGRGIGRFIAIALAQAGANVAITGRTASQVEATTAEINALLLAPTHHQPGNQAIGIVADILKRDEQERLLREVEARLGPLDILICNAGSNTFQPFHLTDPDEWWDILELNLRAPVELTRLALPALRRRSAPATIIYTSSRAATMDLPWTTAYNCAKTGITRFAGTLQIELDQLAEIEGVGAGAAAGGDSTGDHQGRKNGIEVFSIHPGEVDTDLHETAFPEKTKREAPYVIEHMESIGKKRPHFTGELPAWTCVWLCAGGGEALRGKYVDCTRDVEEQARAAKKI